MSAKVHKYKVEMTCDGCVNSVTNVLNKHKDKGIENFNVNLGEKTVSVTSSMDANTILEILSKTGKTVSYIGEGN